MTSQIIGDEMTLKRLARIVCFLSLSLLAAGCRPGPGPKPTFTPTSIASFTPTSSGTSTPTATRTPAPPLTLTATLAPTSTPTLFATVALRKGPDVIYAGNNTQMKIVWQLDTTFTPTLQWGSDNQYSLGSVTTTEYSPDHQHAYTLTNLEPGVKYYFRVIVRSAFSAGSFYAAPPTTAPNLKFSVCGDTRTGTDIFNQLAGQINSTYTADPASQTLNLAVGDLVSSGDLESSWTTEFFDPKYQSIRALLANVPFLSVMGNHEGAGALFAKYFPMPFVAGHYWSFDYGPAHFVMLDQYRPYGAGSAQYAWLATDLGSSSLKWKFIVLHEPGWSAGGGHPNAPTVQKDIQPLAERYGVAIVFGGHNHYYARAVVNGVQHLTVGGGGAPLYTPDLRAPYVVMASRTYSFVEIAISGTVLTGTAVALDGSTIETFTVTK